MELYQQLSSWSKQPEQASFTSVAHLSLGYTPICSVYSQSSVRLN